MSTARPIPLTAQREAEFSSPVSGPDCVHRTAAGGRALKIEPPRIPETQLGQFLARLAGAVAGGIGAMALIGWWINNDWLKCIVPDALPMKPNIAAGMFLGGAGLLLLTREKIDNWLRYLIASVALLIVALAGTTLAENFFGWELGIDKWLVRAVARGVTTSQRMSPATAICFLIMGIALFAKSQSILARFGLPIMAGLSATLAMIGALTLAGFFLEQAFGPRWNFMGMNASGVSAAVGFMALGSGILSLLQNKGELKWSLDNLTAAGFALGLLLMVFAAAAAFNFTKRMLETTTWLTHRQEVLKEIQEVVTDMAELSNRERIYIITGSEGLLREREGLKAIATKDFLDVRKLTPDNPAQQRRLDKLEPLIVQRIDWEEKLIELRCEAGFEEAARLVAAGPGLRLSENIAGLLKEMQNEEYRLLDSDRKRAQTASAAAFLVLPVGVFLSLAILSLGVFFLNAGMTEQKQTENALRESQAQLQTVVENLEEGIVVSDLDGQLLHWNRAALKLHGYESADQPRRRLGEFVDVFELSTLDGSKVSIEQWPLARILRGETLRDWELLVRRVGTDWERIFSYGGTLVHDMTGRSLMAIVTISDITERKRAEEEIRQLNVDLENRVAQRTAELEAANKELEAFSYSVSHDLRAPLRAVDGFSQAVLEDYGPQLPEEGRRYLQTIRDGAQRMGVLIDDLLTFSRLSRLPLHKQAVNMTRLASEALHELNGQRNERQIDVRIGDLPACEGDPALLKQVWVNLLSNAIKYTRKRETALVDVGSRHENGENVYFISDNGTGFDMQFAHKLFGVFQRLHRAEEFEGTGVGLAIVQRVIHRHGGRVWAEAAPDRGATFYFTMKG